MSDSEALTARDKQTQEKIPVPEPNLEEQLKVIDYQLGYGNSPNKSPPEEIMNDLLEERLNVLTKLMRDRRGSK